MTINEKIEEIIKEHSYFIQNDVENLNMPEVIKELLSLIQQEREDALMGFIDYMYGQNLPLKEASAVTVKDFAKKYLSQQKKEVGE